MTSHIGAVSCLSVFVGVMFAWSGLASGQTLLPRVGDAHPSRASGVAHQTAQTGAPRPGDRSGAAIQVEMRDGRRITGELLQVEGGSVTLLEASTGSHVLVRVTDARSLRILKPSRARKGAVIGLLVGALAGGVAIAVSEADDTGGFIDPGIATALGAVFFGGIGAASGAVAGALRGVDEVVRFEGRTPAEVAAVLNRLERSAKYRNGAGVAPAVAPVRQPDASAGQTGAPPVGFSEPATGAPPTASTAVPGAFPRFHVEFGVDYARSEAIGDLKDVMHSVGFDHGEDTCFFGCAHIDFPRVSANSVIVPDVRVDYSLTRTWAMGVAYSRVGQHRVTGREEIANVDYRPGFVAGTELAASYSGGAIAVTASLFPLPDLFLTKSAVRVSIGAGIGRITTSLEGGPYASVPVADGYHVDVRRRRSTVPAVVAGADWIRFFGRSISSQVGVRYRYVPFTLGAGTISAEYPYYSDPRTLIFGAVPVAIPARRMNAGGFGVGAGMGFHW